MYIIFFFTIYLNFLFQYKFSEFSDRYLFHEEKLIKKGVCIEHSTLVHSFTPEAENNS